VQFDVLAGSVVLRRGSHLEQNQMVSAKADIDGAEREEGAQEESRADDQQRGESDLKADERLAAEPLAAARGGLSALFQAAAHFSARCVPCGGEAEEKSRENGDAGGEAENTPIYRDADSVLLPGIGEQAGNDIAT